MKPTLKPGVKVQFSYTVPADKTVPHLYRGEPDFEAMPEVFATGFMVGLMEWSCMKVLAPHLDEGEGSLGISVNITHDAATLPGQTVTVDAECISVDGRRVEFHVSAHDGVDRIGEGSHGRMVVPWDRFIGRVNEKAAKAGVGQIPCPGPAEEQSA